MTGGGGAFALDLLSDLGRMRLACDSTGAGAFLGFLAVKLSIANFSTMPTGISKAILMKNAQK